MTPPSRYVFLPAKLRTEDLHKDPTALSRKRVGGVMTPPYIGFYTWGKAQAVSRLCLGFCGN